ncbi:MAG: zinc dependent phospholipase C family protein [Bacilli bacterium]|nr:zinc dependent phospholipase C family protein [Bacilli bacterium]
MPSTMTHTYFAMDVYDSLSIPLKELLLDHKELLKTASQSLDPLFFYNIANIKNGKKVRKFGNYFHTHKTNEFFITLINYIKYNNYSNNGEIMAYLYGLICHFVLDSTIHPYVVYKTGDFDKTNKKTYKYNQLHGELESFFDNYMVAYRENIIPWKFKCYNFGLNTYELSDSLKEVINFTYKEVFNINKIDSVYISSIKQMKKFYRIFRYDPYGIKKNLYKLIDIVTPNNILRLEPISYHINPKNKENWLNLDNNRWLYPCNDKLKHNESIIDLYCLSLEKTLVIINSINEYIYDNKKIKLDKLFNNLSYFTGRNIDLDEKVKYFEF